MYDFNARWMDNAVPVFTAFDPLAEFWASESPYSYCGGDPVNRMDPTGLMWWKNKYSPLNLQCTESISPPDNKGNWIEMGMEFFLKNQETEDYIYGDLYSYNCQVNFGLVIDKPKQYNFSPEFQNQTLYQASNILGYDFLIGKKIITINELLGDLTIDLRKLGLNVVNPLNPVLSKPFPLKPMSEAEIAKFEQKLQDERNKSPYRKAWDETVNSVTGTLSSWGNDLSSVEWWKYNAPVWGDANRAADAFNSGQYLASAGHVLMGVANLAMVGELATGIGNTVRNAVIKESVAAETIINTTGQSHHLLSNKIISALEKHPLLKGAFSREDTRFIYNALDDTAHKGYQTWHRQYDKMVVDYIESHPELSPSKFKSWLDDLYQQSWLKERVPNVNLNW